MATGLPDSVAYQQAASAIISKQVKHTAFPKHIGVAMREVWSLQSRFSKRSGARAFRLLGHPRFRAAYDFLLLRAETGGADEQLAEWWTQFQLASEIEKKKMVSGLNKTGARKRGRRRKPAAQKQDHE